MTELFRILKMTLRVIFSILSNLSLAKVNSRCFFLFPAAMFVPLRGTQAWRLHTKLYKFMWNILSNNSSTECRTDLTLGQMPYLFILYTMSIS